MKRFLHLILISIFWIYFIQNLNAQLENSQWYFGDYAGISFDSVVPVVRTNGSVISWEGCASVSSPEGDLLFYTDGYYLYDSSHNTMPNGHGLLGDVSSTQSSLIIPQPDSTQYYYVFTTDDVDQIGGINGLCYSKVDMSLNNGLGDVIADVKNISLISPLCEKLTAVKHLNAVDIWVITQKWGTNDFYSYKVTGNGIDDSAVISSTGLVIGGDGTDIDMAKGYLKVSGDGTKIAKANVGLSNIELFDFNNNTGKVSNGMVIPNIGGEPYGIEFSPNCRYLYVNTWKSNPSMFLMQYDLEAGSLHDIMGSRVVIAAGTDGAIQLAPDGKIYVAQAQGDSIHRINSPNNPAEFCGFQKNAIYLGGRKCIWGLPNFMAYACDTTVGIRKDFDRENISIAIFPNPVRDELVISVDKNIREKHHIEFYNINGRKVSASDVQIGKQNRIDVSNWKPGLYVAVAYGNNGLVGRRKFVVK